MIDHDTNTKLKESYTQAAKGYTVATGAAYATMTTAFFDAWISGLESMRPDKASDPKPTSWYRHPDKPQLNPFETTAKTVAWPFSPHQMAQLPIPGWWMFGPTRSPMTTWPMAYGLEATGVPKPIAWPLAEANSAALEAFQIAGEAIQKQLRDLSEPDTSTPRRSADPTTRSSGVTANDNTAPETSRQAMHGLTTPLDLMLQWQAANTDAMNQWWDGIQQLSNAASGMNKRPVNK